MAKRLKTKPGDVVSVPINDTEYCYARVLPTPVMAFYDLKTSGLAEPDDVISAKILFKIMVMDYAFTEGGWTVIGNAPLDDELLKPVWFWNQDMISKKIFIRLGFEEKPATPEEVSGMEREAAWDPEHVEDRLRDHFKGVPNKWAESLAYQPGSET